MRWPSILATASLLSSASSSHLVKRDYDSHDYYAVHLTPEISPHQVAHSLGLHYDGPLGELRDHHIFRAADRHDYDHVKAAQADLKWRRRRRESGAEQAHILDHVLFSQKQELHKRFPLVRRDAPLHSRQGEYENDILIRQGLNIAEDLGIEDPIFQEQWHLFNHVEEGHHLNVSGVWQQGITGKGSAVCIVDDGLDMDSLDLKDNYFAKGSWDFNDVGPDPKPRLSDDRHGTRCAGEVAAVRNDVCGVGVAYDGKVSAVRILSKVISNADEATAMNYAFQENHIYSCSWGPPDDGKSMEAPDVLIQRAMLNGVQNGRGGLGSIYVFAIGNGAAKDDNCNFDGYTNSIYSVSVGGIDRKGLHPYYSEACSAQLVVTYSSGSNDAIHTTDVGLNQCYNGHGGTSAAGPLVAGIYALALQANPNLSWRDIQHITLQTAVKIDQPSDWKMNRAVGKEFSHQFGYGKADAWALVELAKTWKPVKPQAWYFGPWLHVKHPIPEGDHGLTSFFTITRDMLRKANLERIEHVTVTMNVKHTRRGDLSVDLISPSGMVSYLATHRRNDEARAGYNDWTFMSVAHWGESGVGEWTVVVKDTNKNGHNGTFTDWRIKLYGEAIDASKQELLPMPGRHDDDDHDAVETQTPTVGTTTVSKATVTGEPPGNPDNHQHRPVNSKPTVTTTPTPTPTPTPNIPPTADEKADEPTPYNPAFLPRPFPTFGVSKRTQVWIYGAITLILIFLAALGGWALYVRRKRKRRWDDYAFEMVDHDDDDDGKDDGDAPSRPEARFGDANGFASGDVRRGGGGGGAGGGRKKRAGELYDAFAEGSDDEEMFGLGSEDEEESDGEAEKAEARKEGYGRYRDADPGREGLDVE